MIKVSAGIITYNPDIHRLNQNITSISNQVDVVYCFDNASDNISDVRELVGNFKNVQLIENGKNVGIAEGLNQIIARSRTQGIDWLLTLDQDSVCPDRMIDQMLLHAKEPRLAAICPLMVDRRRPQEEIPSTPTEYVDFCITSGCLVNTKISEEIDDFDSWLFIGLVDDEFCHRISINDYRILRLNNLQLDHELGDLTPSRFAGFYRTIGSRLHSKKISALSYKRKISPLRVYYSTRNMVFLSKKYKDFPNSKFSKKRAIYNAFSNILRGQHKVEIAKAAIIGYKEGAHISVKTYAKVKQ